MSQRDIDTNTAVLTLIASTSGEERDRLLDALEDAYAAAVTTVERNLAHGSLPGMRERHTELLARHDRRSSPPPLARGTWLLVLSHLDADSQRLLQRTYEDLTKGAESTREYGEQTDGAVRNVLAGLIPVEDLLVALAHTTLEPSMGPDDEDERRRVLTIEVEWPQEMGVDPDLWLQVRVVWRDGYECQVAAMALMLDGATAIWRLEIEDPVPGRAIEHPTPRKHADPFDVANLGVQDAIEWANGQLAGYTVVPWLE